MMVLRPAVILNPEATMVDCAWLFRKSCCCLEAEFCQSLWLSNIAAT